MKVNANTSIKSKGRFSGLIDLISFNRSVRHLVEILNTEIVAPETVVFRPISHPAGFVRLITKRRLTIAEAYIRLISHSQSENYTDRIEALQVLMHHVWHSKNLSMPINTARVQIALMKKAVRMRGNQRAQLELMSDFSRASYGKTSVIRGLLRELDLIEVPELGEDLSKMHLGWDDHVHDSMTEGRKSPTQLVLDAFIKGISRITVAYYDAASCKTYEEIYLAGQILGIEVKIGIEFSVGKKYERVHYMYIPPQGREYENLSNFLKENTQKLAPFFEGLSVNAKRRRDNVNDLLDGFNSSGLAKYNEPFSTLKHLQMKPLTWENMDKITSKGQANRIHLGQLIYQSMRPVSLKRVLYLKNQYLEMAQNLSRDVTTSWEADRSRKRYEDALKDYESLTPSLCAEKYIAPQKQVDYNSAFENEQNILPILRECGGNIVAIHPLSQGLKRGIDMILNQYPYITDIEVFNLVDALSRDTVEIRQFATFLFAIITEDADHILSLLDEWHIQAPTRECIEKIHNAYAKCPPKMRCASDAVGWSSNIPGMGFIRADVLDARSLKQMRKTGHSVLPLQVSALLSTLSPATKSAGQTDDSTKKTTNSAACSELSTTPRCEIYLMSATQMQTTPKNDGNNDKMTPARLWRYANPNVRCLLLAAIGFIPGYYCLGLNFAILWFVITGFRNIIVDLIASSGLAPKSWRANDIDMENMCESLFFSGLSVPILAGAKFGFDWTWAYFGLAHGFLFTFLKFWAIAFANGLYLVAHNTLRGFDKAAIRGNFFRSVLSWPLATLGSYILTPLSIPDVVQSKIWSEVVAGFIEGTVKNIKQKRLAKKAVLEVYRQIVSANALNAKTARIDILFFWSKYGQGRQVLDRFFNVYKRPIRALTPAENDEIIRANTQIRKSFTTPGSLESLTNVILEYYPEENLPILTEFVGENHAPFVKWLEHKPAK